MALIMVLPKLGLCRLDDKSNSKLQGPFHAIITNEIRVQIWTLVPLLAVDDALCFVSNSRTHKNDK